MIFCPCPVYSYFRSHLYPNPFANYGLVSESLFFLFSTSNVGVSRNIELFAPHNGSPLRGSAYLDGTLFDIADAHYPLDYSYGVPYFFGVSAKGSSFSFTQTYENGLFQTRRYLLLDDPVYNSDANGCGYVSFFYLLEVTKSFDSFAEYSGSSMFIPAGVPHIYHTYDYIHYKPFNYASPDDVAYDKQYPFYFLISGLGQPVETVRGARYLPAPYVRGFNGIFSEGGFKGYNHFERYALFSEFSDVRHPFAGLVAPSGSNADYIYMDIHTGSYIFPPYTSKFLLAAYNSVKKYFSLHDFFVSPFELVNGYQAGTQRLYRPLFNKLWSDYVLKIKPPHLAASYFTNKVTF